MSESDEHSTQGSVSSDGDCLPQRDRQHRSHFALMLSRSTVVHPEGLWPSMAVTCGVDDREPARAVVQLTSSTNAQPQSGDDASISFLVGRGEGSMDSKDYQVLNMAQLFRIDGNGAANGMVCAQAVERVSRSHAVITARWRWCTYSPSTAEEPGCGVWKLVSCTVCDKNSLFGTVYKAMRLIPNIPVHIHEASSWREEEPECRWDPMLVSIGGRKGCHIQLDAGRQAAALAAATPLPVVVDPFLTPRPQLAEASAQTELQLPTSAPPAPKTSKTRSAKERSAAVRRSTSLAPAAREPSMRGPGAAAKVIIVDDDESVPEDAVAKPYAPHSSAATSVPADDENASILETQLQRRRSARLTQSHVSLGTIPADNERRSLTVVTTGTRLTADERKMCEKLSLTVNPQMSEFHTAQYLVMEPPLVRSVKLLTAIPFVEAFLHRSWLDAVFASGRLNVPVARHLYSETYTRRGIEATNGFRVDELASVSTARRQTLLRGFHVYVHAHAQPQDEPHNDMKHVVAASGGVLCRLLSEANLIVLPTTPLSIKDRKSLQQEGFHADAIVITVEDLFRAVLQQRRPNCSTVGWVDTPAEGPTSKRKRARATSPRQRSASRH